MGWYGSYASKAEIIESVTRTCEGGGAVTRTIAKATRGNVFWFVTEQIYPEASSGTLADLRQAPDAKRFIGCVLFRKDKHGWAYKPIDEAAGPYEDSCPLAFFDLVPEPPNLSARDFRARCRNAADARNAARELTKALKPGAMVRLSKRFREAVFEIRQVKPKVLALGQDDRLYRLPPSRLVGATLISTMPYSCRP